MLSLAPATLSLSTGASGTVVATVTQNGAPVAGTVVAFVSDNAAIATVSPSSAQTGASGTAQADVTGVAAGTTTVRASAAGATDTSAVQITAAPAPVPDMSIWGMLVLVLGILAMVGFGRWRHTPPAT
jgi:uncharacterized protein YjdB